MRRPPIYSSSKFFISTTEKCIEVSGDNTAFRGYKFRLAPGRKDEGIWVEWKWVNGRFELFNDWYGFYPLFYYAQDGNLGVSTNIFDLLKSNKVSSKLDNAAMAVFLRLGFFIGEDTPFESIRALPPDCHLSWYDSRLEVYSSSERFQYTTNPSSRQEAIKAYGELFQTVVKRMSDDNNEKVALPLSGGRDSRHILFALSKAGRLPDVCLTVKCDPPRGNDDIRIANIVTKELGVPHIIIEPSNHFLPSEIKKNILTCFCADEHTWILPLADYIREKKYNLIYDGIGGGILSAGSRLDSRRLELYHSGRLDLLADVLLGGRNGANEYRLVKVLSKEMYRRWSYELAVSRLVEELSRYSNAPNPITQFFFWNRTRREIALSPWGILAEPARVFAPFLSRDVFSFLNQLPAEYLLDHTFHTDTTSAFYPEYTHIPYKNKRAPEDIMRRIQNVRFILDMVRFILSEKNNTRYVRRRFLGRLLPCLGLAMIGSPAQGRYPLVNRIPNHFALPIYLTQLCSASKINNIPRKYY